MKLLAYLLALLLRHDREGYRWWRFDFRECHVLVDVTIFDDMKKREVKHAD